jgi:hypothetical protein
MLPSIIVGDFTEELRRFRQLPAELVAFEFLRPFWDHSGKRDPELLRSEAVRERVSRRVEVYGGERALALLLFDDPIELRELFRRPLPAPVDLQRAAHRRSRPA